MQVLAVVINVVMIKVGLTRLNRKLRSIEKRPDERENQLKKNKEVKRLSLQRRISVKN